MTRRVRLFVDTNLFLQCRALHELPWAQLVDADHVESFVAGAVQDEIDRLKSDGNSRRSKRARAASSLFRETLRSPDLTRVIQENAPRVTLTFPEPLPVNRPANPTLDPASGDDRLIEEALVNRVAGSADETSPDVRILTQDVGLILRARRHGVRYVETPDDWRLPPEPDANEKRIAALERRLEHLQSVGPLLVLEVTDDRGPVAHALEPEIATFPPLSAEEIRAVENHITAKHPMATDFSEPELLLPRLTFSQWRRPSDDQIRKYQESAYPAWREAVRTAIASLAEDLNTRSQAFGLSIILHNDGSRPADRTLVSDQRTAFFRAERCSRQTARHVTVEVRHDDDGSD